MSVAGRIVTSVHERGGAMLRRYGVLTMAGVLWAGMALASGYPDGDFNDDGVVNLSDLAIVCGMWPATGPCPDFNADGSQDIEDLTWFFVTFPAAYDGSMPVEGADIRIVVDPGVQVGPGLRMWAVRLVSDSIDEMAWAFQGVFTGVMNQAYAAGIATPTMEYGKQLPDPDVDTHFMMGESGDIILWAEEDGPGAGTYLDGAIGFIASANTDIELARIVIPIGQVVMLNGAACEASGLGSLYADILLGRDKGDTDGDLKVDIVDLTALAANWSALSPGPKGWTEGDFNYDSVVDIQDLTALAGNWTAVGTGPSAPEPATLALLAFGGAALLGSRTRRSNG